MKKSRTKQQKNRRKKVRRPPLFYIFVLFLAVAITVVVVINTVFKINTVRVVGNTSYEKSKIEITSGIVDGDNYFFINKAQAIERIEASYSYLEGTKIKYQMFSTVVVEVADATPFFVIETEQGAALISPNFKVLEYPAISAHDGVAEVKGLDINPMVEGEHLSFVEALGEQKKEALLEVLNAMNSLELSAVNSIDVTNLHDIRMVYEERVIIIFGSKAKAEKKVRALNELMTIRFPAPQIIRIDCSYEEDEDNPRCYVLPLSSLDQWEKLEKTKEDLSDVDPNTLLSSESTSDASGGNSSGSKSSGGSGTSSKSTTSSKSGSTVSQTTSASSTSVGSQEEKSKASTPEITSTTVTSEKEEVSSYQVLTRSTG